MTLVFSFSSLFCLPQEKDNGCIQDGPCAWLLKPSYVPPFHPFFLFSGYFLAKIMFPLHILSSDASEPHILLPSHQVTRNIKWPFFWGWVGLPCFLGFSRGFFFLGGFVFLYDFDPSMETGTRSPPPLNKTSFLLPSCFFGSPFRPTPVILDSPTYHKRQFDSLPFNLAPHRPQIDKKRRRGHFHGTFPHSPTILPLTAWVDFAGWVSMKVSRKT